MFVTLDDDCCGTTAGNQSIAVPVEGTAGFCGLILTVREGHQSVEGGHAVHIGFLGTAADDTVLQAILDQEISQTNGM